MINRRQFLKSLVVAPLVVPAIVKATPEPDNFVFDDIGPRGVAQLTEREQQAVLHHMRAYLGTDDIHWNIPGKKSHCQGVLILDDSYVVTFKDHPRNGSRRVYIEVERTFTGEPSQFLTDHSNAVWKQYMKKRTGQV